jgi:hypothetical protein
MSGLIESGMAEPDMIESRKKSARSGTGQENDAR